MLGRTTLKDCNSLLRRHLLTGSVSLNLCTYLLAFFVIVIPVVFVAFYIFLTGTSSGMKTLTVKSLLSVPYLFFTKMLYFPESLVFTVVMVKLANLPDSNLRT